jgi:hypothetical protein
MGTNVWCEEPPRWLKSDDADRTIRHIAFGTVAACVAVLLANYFDVFNMRLLQKLLFGIGCLAVLGAITWSLLTPDKAIVASPQSPFTLGPHIYSESHHVKGTDGRETKLYENIFYLIVSNSSEDGKTLRKVETELRGYEAPVVAAIKDSTASEVDIKHGNAAFFVIGRIVSPDRTGLSQGPVAIEDRLLKAFEQRGQAPSFYIGTAENKYQFALSSVPYPSTGWELFAVISAEDRKSRSVKLIVDPRDKKNPVTYADSKF